MPINIDPTRFWQQVWDLYMVVLLIIVSMLTPYEVCFLEPEMFSFLFWLNRMIDASFMADMGRQFCIPVTAWAGEEEGNVLIRDNWGIAQRYFKSWFFVDVVSIVPFDVITATLMGGSGELRALRVVRLMRLLKLFRVLRSMGMIQQALSQVAVPYSMLQLTKFIVVVLMMSHWFGCLWYFSHTMSGGGVNWVTAYGIQDRSVTEKYASSFYWAVMTLTTIGYGDITPTSALEQSVATCTMLVGAGTYAYVVGGICGIFSSMDEDLTAYHSALDHLNSYMVEMRISADLQGRLRHYFHCCKSMHKEPYNRNVVDLMSPGLRQEFSHECYSKWIEVIPFLYQHGIQDEGQRAVQNSFVTQISARLRLRAYPAHECIIIANEVAENLYIIRNGLVGLQGKLQRNNAVFGEDMLIRAVREYVATSLTFTRVLALSRDDLLEVVEQGSDKFNWIKERMCHAARWIKFRHGLVGLAREYNLMAELQAEHQRSGGEDVLLKWANDSRSHLMVTAGGRKHRIKRVHILKHLDHFGPLLGRVKDEAHKIDVHQHSTAVVRTDKVGSADKVEFVKELVSQVLLAQGSESMLAQLRTEKMVRLDCEAKCARAEALLAAGQQVQGNGFIMEQLERERKLRISLELKVARAKTLLETATGQVKYAQ